MSIERYWPGSSKTRLAGLVISCVMVVLSFCASPLLSDTAPQEQHPSSSGHQLVVLLDVNANQRKVLPVELSLAEGVIQKLDQPGNVFSVITFGSQTPALLKPWVHADEVLAAIRDVSSEETRPNYLSVHLYEALNLAFGRFADDARPKSLLIITEGNDERDKMFQESLSRAQQLHVACNVAMVAGHTFYGTKAIQRYGFYLRELAGKTRGRYIEVGDRQKKIPRSVDRFSKGILAQDWK